MNRRTPITVAAVLGSAALLATACQIDINTGEEVTRTFDISDFEHLEIDSAFEVTIEVGPEATLEIDINEEVLDRLDVDQDGDRLSIGFDGGLVSFSGSKEARITTPSLSSLDFDGAVGAEITGLDSERLELDLDGASSVTASGSVGVLVINADGASNVDFDDVEIDEVEIDANGASSIDVSEAKAVSGRANGASSIDVSDSATVDVRTSGASSID